MSKPRGRLLNTVLSAVLALLLVAAVALYVFSEPLYERQRADAIEQVLNIHAGGTLAVDVDAGAYPVRGEEGAGVAADAAERAVWTAPEQLANGRAALFLYGVLSVPELSLTLPLYYGADPAALRFGAGVDVPADSTAPLIVFGLRTRVAGRLLHDIDQLSEGSGVTLSHADNTRTAYTVACVRLITADMLTGELADPPDMCTAALVSNHPAGETGGRIVVWLEPV